MVYMGFKENETSISLNLSTQFYLEIVQDVLICHILFFNLMRYVYCTIVSNRVMMKNGTLDLIQLKFQRLQCEAFHHFNR